MTIDPSYFFSHHGHDSLTSPAIGDHLFAVTETLCHGTPPEGARM